MRRWIALVTAVAIAVAVGVGALWQRNRPWRDGSRHGPWETVFTGYGVVRGGDERLDLSPQPVDDGPGTHAALVVTSRRYTDLALSVRLRTERQFRRGEPNAWEVGWVLWSYGSTTRFYALVLKPTGWELSKQDPSFPKGQRFLASGTTPTFAVGSWHQVGIVQIGNRLRVAADGYALATVVDQESYYAGGRVGFYTEDAHVRFEDIRITNVGTG